MSGLSGDLGGAVPARLRLDRMAAWRSSTAWLGFAGVTAFLLVWQLGTWLNSPVIGKVPSPVAVAHALVGLAGSAGYWSSWYASGIRVMWGSPPRW